MKIVEYWRWRLHSEIPPHKAYVASWNMTEADALARDPAAQRVEGSGIARAQAETPEELDWAVAATCVANAPPDEVLQRRRRDVEAQAWAEYLAAGGACRRA